MHTLYMHMPGMPMDHTHAFRPATPSHLSSPHPRVFEVLSLEAGTFHNVHTTLTLEQLDSQHATTAQLLDAHPHLEQCGDLDARINERTYAKAAVDELVHIKAALKELTWHETRHPQLLCAIAQLRDLLRGAAICTQRGGVVPRIVKLIYREGVAIDECDRHPRQSQLLAREARLHQLRN